MKRRLLSVLLLITLLLSLIAGLSGCGKGGSESVSVAIPA